jgi:hypothetical protein
MSTRTVLGLSFVFILIVVVISGAQEPGQNVNMVSGTKWPGGDPFLQRQNEPSMAVSTRNPQHLLAGANDYRTVDLNLVDQLPINQLNGDAWLGVFKSFDGGQRWQSTLLPGFPQDRSSFGAVSPMRGFGAASDPVVRAGTNGMFYYSSIALNRSTNLGGLFLSRFIDLNNKENGDGAQSKYPAPTTDPIRYLNTVKIDSGTAGQFIDKPWIAVDIPRAGAGTCTMQVPVDNGTTVTQSFPAGNVYIAYAKFVGGTINIRSKITFAKSSDCGATWTKPIMISQTYDINQGTQVAVDPETGYVYVAWRVFSAGNNSDEIVVAKSTDGGNTFSKAVPVRMLSPFNSATPSASAFFDEGTTDTAFRTQSMPAIAVDDSGSPGLPGKVYVAWSERGIGPNGDARILLSVSPDGITWPAPTAVDNNPLSDDATNQFARGHQLMPAMTFIEGKLMILYYDLRLDHTVGLFSIANPFPDAEGRFFPESRDYLGDPSAAVFTPFVDDAGLTQRRHTIDVVVSQSSGGVNPTFTHARVSRYDFGLPAPEGNGDQFEQLRVNPPNLPMFAQGTVPFIGDYIDIAGQMFAPAPGGGWTFNNPAPPGTTATSKPPVGSPVHYSTWTTNQDVVPPPDGNWAKYTPITNGTSIYNGTATQPCATDSQGFGWEGDRNQNIYDSRITQGLLVTSPQNSKPLLDKAGNPIQRAFAVLVQNSTNLTKYFQLTIANQPPGNFNINNNGTITVGGYASFQQAVPNQPALPNPLPGPVTVSNVAMSPHSGAVRTVFVLSNVINASVSVNVNETDQNGNVISGGLSSFLVLNADPSVVAQLALPDGSSTDPNLAEIYDPNIVTPNIITPNITTPNITTPNIITPNIITPNIVTPNITTPNIVTPNITTPNIVTTGVTNPNIVTPNITTPNITTSSLTDAVYTISNKGNTNAGYHVKLTGNTNTQLQLAVAQVYTTPTSYQCALIPQVQNVTLTNVTSPEFTPVSQLGTPNIVTADPNDATIYLGPGDTAEIVLRGFVDVPTMQQIVTTVAPVVIPEAIDTNSTATTPPFVAPLFIATAALPNGSGGGAYNTTLLAIGGTPPYTWSIVSGALPPGLTLNPTSGAISGTPTAPGTYSFVIQVSDSATPANKITRSLTIQVIPQLVITTTTLAQAIVGIAYGPQQLAATGGVPPYCWSLSANTCAEGTANIGTTGFTLTAPGGTIAGTPLLAGNNQFTIFVTDSGNPTQTTSATITIPVSGPQITTTSVPNGAVGTFYSFTLTRLGGVGTVAWSIISGALPPGVTLGAASGTLSGTPTSSGTFNFTVQALDSNGNVGAQAFTLNVAPGFGDFILTDGSPESTSGRVLRIASDGSNSNTVATLPARPMAIATTPTGDFIVTGVNGPNSPQLFKVTAFGAVTTLHSGTPLAGPIAVAVDPKTGNIFVGDNSADQIEEFAPDGTPMGQIALPAPSTTTLQDIRLAFDTAGNLVVGNGEVNGNVGTLEILLLPGADVSGSFNTAVYTGTAPGDVGGLAIDANGSYVIADFRTNSIYRIDLPTVDQSIVQVVTGTGGSGDPLCCVMTSLQIASSGNYFVSLNVSAAIDSIILGEGATISPFFQGAPLTFPTDMVIYNFGSPPVVIGSLSGSVPAGN